LCDFTAQSDHMTKIALSDYWPCDMPVCCFMEMKWWYDFESTRRYWYGILSLFQSCASSSLVSYSYQSLFTSAISRLNKISLRILVNSCIKSAALAERHTPPQTRLCPAKNGQQRERFLSCDIIVQ